MRFGRADCHGRVGTFDCSAMDWFLERARALGVEHEAPKPILMGRHLLDLGVPPGPRMGEILKAVYEQQLDGVVTTLDQAIETARGLLGGRDEASVWWQSRRYRHFFSSVEHVRVPRRYQRQSW